MSGGGGSGMLYGERWFRGLHGRYVIILARTFELAQQRFIAASPETVLQVRSYLLPNVQRYL